MLAGTSVGGALFPPIASALLIRFGWHDAFRILALLPLLLLPMLMPILREPRGDRTEAERPSDASDADRARVRITPELLLVGLVAVAIFYAANSFIRHSFLFLRFEGLGLPAAAKGISTVYLFGLVGKIVAGAALEKVALRPLFLGYQALTLAGTLLLIASGAQHAGIALALIGLGWGGGYTLTQLSAARLLAGPKLGRALGGFVVVESLAQGFGSFLTGVFHDLSGSYRAPFLLIAAMMAGAMAITLFSPAFRRGTRLTGS